MGHIQISDASFKKDVLESAIPVLVDFWAEWCGPCKMIAPAVEELAKEYAHKIKVAKINIDDNPQSASSYGVMSIPTLLFFKKGKVVGQSVGAISKADLKKKIEENIR